MIRKISFIALLYFTSLTLTFLPIAIIKIGITADILPVLEISIIYFLALNFPIPIWQIFLYGIFIDELYGTPIGLNSALLIIISAALQKLHILLISKPPFSNIIGFIITSACFIILKYLILTYQFGHIVPFSKIIMQYFATIIFYPAIYYMLNKILRATEI